MPRPIILSKLDPPVKSATNPMASTRADLRDGSRGDSGGVAPGGDGSTDQVSWTATALADGGELTLTDAGLRLAPRVTPFTRQWVMGDEVYLNNLVASDGPVGGAPSLDLWDSVGSGHEIVADNLRHERLSKQYRILAGSLLWRPLGMRNISFNEGRKFQMSWYVYTRTTQQIRIYYVPKPADLSGFITYPTCELGEEVSVTKDGVVIGTGHIVRIFERETDYVITLTGVPYAETPGSTITGLVSGAIMQIPADSAKQLPASNKTFRVTQGGGGAPLPSIRSTGSATTQFFILAKNAQDETVNSPSMVYADSVYSSKYRLKHSLHELVMDFSGPTGEAHLIIDGEVIYSFTGVDSQWLDQSVGFELSNAGIDVPGGPPKEAVGICIDQGEYLFDNDNQTWLLTDSAVFANSTKFERCRIKDWDHASGQCVLVLYQGALASISGSYLHLRRNADIVIEGIAL